MKQIKSEVIKVPPITFDSENRASDALAYTYGSQTAEPWLEEYVIDPFRDNFREKVFQKARSEDGFDEFGNLTDRFSISKTLDGKKFLQKAYPSHRHDYEDLLSSIEGFLGKTLEDNRKGVRKAGVRRVGEDVYISVASLLDNVDDFKDETSSLFNYPRLLMRDPETGDSLDLDEEIEEMKIELDPRRYSEINERTAREYYKAQSLRLKGIKPLLEEYEKKTMDEHGIPEEGLEERKDFVYDLGNYRIRFTFKPRTSTRYGDIFKDFFGPQETKKVSSSTGDMPILEKKAFMGDYSYPRGNIRVFTESESDENSNGRRGETFIIRTKDDEKNVRAYPVFTYNDKVYVSISEILDKLNGAKEEYTSSKTKFEIEASPVV